MGESTLKLRYSTCRDGGFLEIGGAVKRVAKAARSLAASFAVHIKNEFVPLVSHSTFVSEKKQISHSLVFVLKHPASMVRHVPSTANNNHGWIKFKQISDSLSVTHFISLVNCASTDRVDHL